MIMGLKATHNGITLESKILKLRLIALTSLIFKSLNQTIQKA
jgi:hypothetical protein